MLSNSESTTAQASELGGQTVAIQSGADTRIVGSNVLADQRLDINAGGNLNIEAAQNTQGGSDFNETKKSGLFGSGGIGFTIGKQQQSTDAQNTQTTAAASTVGAIAGDVNLSAGQTYTQRGSDVVAPGGDVNISAQRVTIEEARETASSQTEQRFKQSGVTVAVTSPVLSAVQTAAQQIEAAGDTRSDRMKALAVANAAINLKQAADALAAGQGMVKGADGELVQGNAADKAGGIGISVSLGSSRSQSNSSQSSDSALGSSVTAGGDVNISARGADADSDITIQGSQIKADGTTRLSAEDEVRLLAAKNTQTETNSQSSKSGSIGVGIQLGAGGAQMGVTVSASAGKGQGAGDGTTYTNTQVSGQAVQIESGGDTTLKGAVVKADQVAVNVGGNLTIESQQDQSQYLEKSQQVGGSVTIGPASGGSLSAGQTKINSNYQSVNEQTAIRAGDGGFQVSVAGKTDLVGGQITSTQAAIDNNKNSYQAQGGTSTRDLNNSASFEASSVSVGLGAGTPKPGASLSAGLSGVGIGSDKGSASSTTTAGISGIAGNTAARTGDAETGIKPIFNQDEARREVNAQVAITQEFGKQFSKAVGEFADTQLAEANRKEREAEQAKANGDNARAEQLQAEASAIKDNWDNNGKLRLAVHTAIGALTGGTSGALGAASGTLTAPLVADALRKAGVDETLASGLTALASTAVGAATGGSAGAAAAFNEVTNNYLSKPEAVRNPQVRQKILEAGKDCRGPSSCDSMVAGMDAQIKLLSDDKIVSMCAGDAQCVTDRKDERSLYVQVRNEAASKLEPEAAARAYLNSQSSAPYDKQQLAAALTRVQNGTAQANNPVDQYVRNSLAADPPMLAAVLSVSAFDTDGGRSAPRSGVGDALAERGSPVPDEVAALRRIASNQNGPDLANKAPNSVLNQQAIKDLADGKLPGVTYNSKTGLPDVVPRTGVPREMPASPNPNATAEDFAFRMLGRQPTPQEVARGELMFGGNCPGCWVGKTQDGVVITFRPAGKATKTLNDTASVDINFITNDINNGRPLKLKFPGDK